MPAQTLAPKNSGAATGPAWRAKAPGANTTGAVAEDGGKTPGLALLDLRPENDVPKRDPHRAMTSVTLLGYSSSSGTSRSRDGGRDRAIITAARTVTCHPASPEGRPLNKYRGNEQSEAGAIPACGATCKNQVTVLAAPDGQRPPLSDGSHPSRGKNPVASYARRAIASVVARDRATIKELVHK